jgi:large subunit ribosomal protein L22
MMRYSINIDREAIALAHGKDIDASYKDLAVVCDAIRYLKTDRALDVLEGVISLRMPILFTKFNRYMGSRHELGGRKGAYPVKAAKEVRHVLVNAIANSKNMGLDENALYIVHASANKTRIERRGPSKGSLSWGRGMYGLSARVHSDLEYSKVEIGLANSDAESLTPNMKTMMKIRNPVRKTETKPKPQQAKPKEKPAVAKQAAATKK